MAKVLVFLILALMTIMLAQSAVGLPAGVGHAGEEAGQVGEGLWEKGEETAKEAFDWAKEAWDKKDEIEKVPELATSGYGAGSISSYRMCLALFLGAFLAV